MVAAAWSFDELTHTYRDEHGIAIPSVTQVLKAEGLVCFDGIHPKTLERKRQLGSLVHKATELYDKGENLEHFDIPDEVFEYLHGYWNFCADCGFTPELIEHRALAEVYKMRYGMTLDRRGEIDGVPYIVELKCGSSEDPAWGVQLAAYDLGINEVNLRPRLARAVVQLGPQFPRGYKTHKYDDPADYQIWMNSLATTIWKINKKKLAWEPIPERLEI